MVEEIQIGENEFKSKSTDIQGILKSFELRLSGHITSYKSKKFIYTGDCLAGDFVTQKLVGLLDSFAKSGNLITSKKDLTFFKQRFLSGQVVNGTLLTEDGGLAENYILLMTMYRTCLQNIGDIILSSKDLMRGVLGVNEDTTKRGLDM